MIVDFFMLIAILAGLHYYKEKHRNFLFFPKGAMLFLPPQDSAQTKPNKKKGKTQNEVNVIKIQFQNVKDYPFNVEFSRIIMTTVGLVLFVILKICVNLIYSGQSLLSFYVLVLILIYSIKMGIDTFLLTNYNKKICFLIALGINISFYIIMLSLDGLEGVYDRTIKRVASDYNKHLSIVLNQQINFVTHKAILGLILCVNFFITIAVIPSIIKFGNWYTKTLKETNYEQEGQSREMARLVNTQQKDVKEQQKRLKQQSKELIQDLNIYLAAMLLLIVSSHRYFQSYLAEQIIDALRGFFMGYCAFIITSTMSQAIEFNGSFAYKFVLQFFKTQNAEKRAQLRKQIIPYIYYIWYHFFQFIIRLIVPLLLFLLIINWKYLVVDQSLVSGDIKDRSLHIQTECPLNTNHLAILESLYRCPASVTAPSKVTERYFLNGIITSASKITEPAIMQSNIINYGLLTKSIMVQCCQQIFWYSSLTIYLMTVVYILFLRKTVYDI